MKHRILWMIAVVLAHCLNLDDLRTLSIYMQGWREEIEAERRLGL